MLFKNALLADGTRKDILTENGKIARIEPHIEGSGIDCSPFLLFSGMVDSHVHFRDPGFPHKETAETGTKAALRGGVTSVIDMPNTNPLCVTVQALAQKHHIYREHAFCNYGFHFGGDARNNATEVSQAQGFASLKIFLNESTGYMLVTDDKVLDDLFAASHFVSVHAEGDAVDKALHFAKKHQNTLYLCHISLEEELLLIKKAKVQKQCVYAEATPHHVLFCDQDESPLLTMKPCLRSSRNRDKLKEALDDNLIDTWGTDHAPHLISEKEEKLTYGIEGIEFALENLITLAHEMNWTIDKVERLYSRTPASIFGIPHKGGVTLHKDADFVLIDPTPYTPTQQDIVSLCGWSPYVGRPLKARVHATYIGGELSYHDGSFQKSPYVNPIQYQR
ncbi:MAG: dihydroorotase [Brevinema sp.]